MSANNKEVAQATGKLPAQEPTKVFKTIDGDQSYECVVAEAAGGSDAGSDHVVRLICGTSPYSKFGQPQTLRYSKRLVARIEQLGANPDDPDTFQLINIWNASVFAESRQLIGDWKAKAEDPDTKPIIDIVGDPFVPVRHSNPARRAELEKYIADVVCAVLESTAGAMDVIVRLNSAFPGVKVAIPIAAKYAHRVLIGTHISTTDAGLAAIYEPNLPSPAERIALLEAAKAAGIPVYVVMDPIYPDQYERDINDVITAVKPFDPELIYVRPGYAPSDVRKALAEKFKDAARKPNLGVFDSTRKTAAFMLSVVNTAQRVAAAHGMEDRLRLLPDLKKLTTDAALNLVCEAKAGQIIQEHKQWLNDLVAVAKQPWQPRTEVTG